MEVSIAQFTKRLAVLENLATMGDRLSSVSGLPHYVLRELSEERKNFFYELAFLRVCYTWEWFIEESFLMSLCKNPKVSPQGTLNQPPFKNPTEARAAMLATKSYISWGNIDTAIATLQQFVVNGIHERVIMSYKPELRAYLAIRHHIAHDSKTSETKFDAAAKFLSLKSYEMGPGAFLRDRTRRCVYPTKWFKYISDDFLNLAKQIDPR